MSIYEYSLPKRDNSPFPLSELKGKVSIIVNTATGCGFTPQYAGLEALYQKYHDLGLEIIDFPCDQFGHQAPGTDDEIHEFCIAKYNTTFDQFAKGDVNGENEHPLYTFLKSQIEEDIISGLKNQTIMQGVKLLSKTCKKPGDIVRNFTKFLIDREGNVVKRYSPTYNPEDMEDDIRSLI